MGAQYFQGLHELQQEMKGSRTPENQVRSLWSPMSTVFKNRKIKYAIKTGLWTPKTCVAEEKEQTAHQHPFEVQPIEINESSGVTDTAKESPSHKGIAVTLSPQEAHELTSIFPSKHNLN